MTSVSWEDEPRSVCGVSQPGNMNLPPELHVNLVTAVPLRNRALDPNTADDNDTCHLADTPADDHIPIPATPLPIQSVATFSRVEHKRRISSGYWGGKRTTKKSIALQGHSAGCRMRTSVRARSKGRTGGSGNTRGGSDGGGAGTGNDGGLSVEDIEDTPELVVAKRGTEPTTGSECQWQEAKPSLSARRRQTQSELRYGCQEKQHGRNYSLYHGNNDGTLPLRQRSSSSHGSRRHRSALVFHVSTRQSGASPARAASASQSVRPLSTSRQGLTGLGGMRQGNRLRPRPLLMMGYEGGRSPPRSPLSRQRTNLGFVSSEEDMDSLFRFDDRSTAGSSRSNGSPATKDGREHTALPSFEFKSYDRERNPIISRTITIQHADAPECGQFEQIDIGIGGNYRRLCASVERDIASRRRENSFLSLPRDRSLSPSPSLKQTSMFGENKRRRVEFRNETPDIVQLPDDDHSDAQIDHKRMFDSNRLSVDTLSLGCPSPPRSILKKRQLTPELHRRGVSLSPTPRVALTRAASLTDDHDVITRLPSLSPSSSTDVTKLEPTYLAPRFTPQPTLLAPNDSSSPKLGIKFQCSKEFATAFEKLEDS